MRPGFRYATLILIRGLPGSGKSTLAQNLCNAMDPQHKRLALHFEADMFFMEGQDYRFDPTRLKEAHAWCQEQVRNAMRDYTPTVIVSNTFVKHWEMKAYKDMAKEYNYKVQEVTVTGDPSWSNVHGVPAHVIERMRKNWEV